MLEVVFPTPPLNAATVMIMPASLAKPYRTVKLFKVRNYESVKTSQSHVEHSPGSRRAAGRAKSAPRMPQDRREPLRGRLHLKRPCARSVDGSGPNLAIQTSNPALASTLTTKKDKRRDRRSFSPVGSLSGRPAFGPGFSGLSKFQTFGVSKFQKRCAGRKHRPMGSFYAGTFSLPEASTGRGGPLRGRVS